MQGIGEGTNVLTKTLGTSRLCLCYDHNSATLAVFTQVNTDR